MKLLEHVFTNRDNVNGNFNNYLQQILIHPQKPVIQKVHLPSMFFKMTLAALTE